MNYSDLRKKHGIHQAPSKPVDPVKAAGVSSTVNSGGYNALRNRHGIGTGFEKILRESGNSVKGNSGNGGRGYAALRKKHGILYDVDQNYITGFLSDANRYMTTAKDDYEKISWGNAASAHESRHKTWEDLESRYTTVRGWLYANRENLESDSYNGLTDYLDSYKAGASSILDSFQRARDYYAQWETETDYNRWNQYHHKTYPEITALLEEMEDGEEKDWLKSFAPSVMTASDYENQISGLDSEIQALEAVLEEANGIQSRIAQLSRNPYGWKEANNPMSEAYSQLQTVLGEYQDVGAVKDQIEKLNAQKYRYEHDKVYNFLEENADFQEKSTNVPEMPTKGFGIQWGKWYWGEGDPQYDYINDIDGTRQNSQTWSVDAQNPYGIYDYMDKREIARYNYLYDPEDTSAAQEYLDYLEPTLNQRRKGVVTENIQKLAEEAPVLSSVLSVPLNLMSGAGTVDILWQNLEQSVSEAVTGEYAGPIDYNTPAVVGSTAAATIRGTVAQGIADKTGVIQLDREEHPILSRIFNGKSLGDVYQLGMSMADSGAVAMLSPVLGSYGTALLGGSAATQGILDAVERGASDEQALAMGMLSGAFEMLFEKYELENLLGGDTNALKAFANQALTEGIGEGATSLANTAADILVMAEKSDLSAAVAEYQKRGFSSRDARKQALLDTAIGIGWDFIGGMAMGGIMGASSAETKKLTQKLEQKESGGQGFEKYIQALEKAGMLPDKAGSAAVGSAGEHTGDITQGPKFSERNAASGSANSYDGKKLYADGAVYDYAFMTAQKPMNVATMPSLSAVKENDRISTEKAVLLGLENARQLGREIDKGQYAIVNDYTGQEIIIGQHGLDHSLDGENVSRLRTNARLSAIGGELVKNAIPINGLKNKNRQASGTYAMACLVNDNGSKTVAIITVEEHTSKVINIGYVNITHSLNGRFLGKKGDSRSSTREPRYGLDESALATAISKISIADFLEIVNQTHRSILSEDVLRHFNEARPETGYYTGRALFQSREDAGKDNPRSGQLQQAEASSPQQLSAFRKYAEEAGLQLEAVQETALQTMEKLSAVLGVKFYIYQSYGRDGKRYYVDESGREKAAPNGKYYADGRIYVDLNAGDGGKGTMLYTVSHELTHFIRQWSKAKYEVLADFLVEQYGRAGLRADNLVVEQMAKARRQGRKLSWEEAHEEMVADSMEAMLTDGNVVRTMAELKRKDKTLWQKICRWFRNLAEDLKAVVEAYKGHKPDSAEGQMVAGMRDVIGKLESLYADALMDAGENFQAAADKQKISTREGGVRYNMRDIKIARTYIDYSDINTVNNAISEKVSDLVDRQKTVPLSDTRILNYQSSVEWTDKNAVRKLLRKILDSHLGTSVYFTYDGRRASAYLTRVGIDHSVGGPASPRKAAAFEMFKELIKKAEYTYSSKNDRHSNNNGRINGKIDWDCFTAVAMIRGEPYPVVFKIRTIDTDVRSQIYEIASKNETGYSRGDVHQEA